MFFKLFQLPIRKTIIMLQSRLVSFSPSSQHQVRFQGKPSFKPNQFLKKFNEAKQDGYKNFYKNKSYKSIERGAHVNRFVKSKNYFVRLLHIPLAIFYGMIDSGVHATNRIGIHLAKTDKKELDKFRHAGVIESAKRGFKANGQRIPNKFKKLLDTIK
jgi:hypothetical protein